MTILPPKNIAKEVWERKITDLLNKKYAIPYLIQLIVRHILALEGQKEELMSKSAALDTNIKALDTEKAALEAKIAELESKVTVLEAK